MTPSRSRRGTLVAFVASLALGLTPAAIVSARYDDVARDDDDDDARRARGREGSAQRSTSHAAIGVRLTPARARHAGEDAATSRLERDAGRARASFDAGAPTPRLVGWHLPRVARIAHPRTCAASDARRVLRLAACAPVGSPEVEPVSGPDPPSAGLARLTIPLARECRPAVQPSEAPARTLCPREARISVSSSNGPSHVGARAALRSGPSGVRPSSRRPGARVT